MLLNQYSLLARVAPGLTSQLENLATESLLYLLQRYGETREAFVELASTVGYAGPRDLRFSTQVQMQHGNIPDLVGATTDGTDVLLVESKFWASLTPNQPTGYLDRLPENGKGMVLFIAPTKRHEDLWQQLVTRCRRKELEPAEEAVEAPNWRVARTSKGRLAYVSWSFILGRLEERLKQVGEERGANEVWQLKELCRRLEEPPGEEPSDLQSIVDEVASRLTKRGIFHTKGYRAQPSPRSYRRYGTLSGHINWFVEYNEPYADRFDESVLWVGGPSADMTGREPLPSPEADTPRAYENKVSKEILFPLRIPDQMPREPIIQSLVTQVEGIAELLPKRDLETGAEALGALTRAWVPFVAECRSVLGSELHYQALLYHCLRTYGGVPPKQLGMNVKIWIERVTSEYFINLDKDHTEGYGGGYEPIPDLVIFRPEIEGDFRRRNNENTLRQMLVAVEVKAAEKRHLGRLRSSEIVNDVHKLDALRKEVLSKGGSEPLPAVVVVDTAPERKERMTPEARGEVEAAARECRVGLFYVFPSDESVVLPDVP